MSRFQAFVAYYTLLVRCVALCLLCVTVYRGVNCFKFSCSLHSERNALKRKNHRVSKENFLKLLFVFTVGPDETLKPRHLNFARF